MARKDAIENLRQVLLRRRETIRRALRGDMSLMKDLREQGSGDVIDNVVGSAHDELSSQLAEVESRELIHIENALQRMRAGVYGICENCESKIPLARLQALPYATLCIHCQREAEKEAGYGTGGWSRFPQSAMDPGINLNDIELDV